MKSMLGIAKAGASLFALVFERCGIAALAAGALFLGAGLPARAQASDASETIEEITVVGTRASLRRSLEAKRDSVNVIDAILAEDIGKFPDLNVSESLQRITGVTVNRSVTGEGKTVSVRGLPPEYTRVTLNGLTATSGNEGRDFDFDVFASDLFSSIRLTKTPSASLTEGGLAGTIDLRTPRPFELGDRRALFSVSGQYADLGRDEVTPRVSGLYSWNNADETFGFSTSASYSESTIRNDTRQGFRYELLRANTGLDEQVAAGTPTTVNVNGTDVSDFAALTDLADTVAFPVLPRVGLDIKDRTRLGLTTSFQFRPNEDVELAFDVLYAKFEEEGERHTIDGAPGFSGTAAVPLALTTIAGDAVEYAVAGTFSGVSQRAESVDETFDSDMIHITFDGDYIVSDSWSLRSAIGYSHAEENEIRRTYLYDNVGDYSYDLTDPEWPRFNGATFDYLDPDDYDPNQLRFRPRTREDQAMKVRLDSEWQLRSGVLVTAGVEHHNRKKENRTLSEIRPTPALPFSAVATDLPVNDFMSGAPAGVVTDFLVTDLGAGRELLLPDSTYELTSPDLRASWVVDERILSGFVQADWSLDINGKPLLINLGVRVTDTDQTSDGHQQSGGTFTPVSVKNRYTDVLPSLNVRWNVTDELIARFAANRAITRPTLSQLSAGTTVNSTNNLTATAGNPELDPFRANQLDLGLEWYFENESVLGATLFYKDMESFIVTSQEERVIVGANMINDAGEDVSGETFIVTLPINGTGGKLKGLEVFYQQPLPFFEGLGVLANVTVADSEGTNVQGGETIKQRLLGQSNLSYNLIAYYENERLSARAAYAYRDEYADQFRNGLWPSGEPHTLYVAERKQLDLSFRYSFNEMTQIYVDAININGEDYYSYDTDPGMSRDYFAQGAVYNFGFRLKFQN